MIQILDLAAKTFSTLINSSMNSRKIDSVGEKMDILTCITGTYK